MNLKCIFATQRSTGYRYEVPRSTLFHSQRSTGYRYGVAAHTATRYPVLRWLASGEPDMYMKCIFETQRSVW